MKLPHYPAYKPSGVEWLGDVPEHWAAQGVKFCYSIQLGKMLQPEPASPTDEETPYLKSQHVQWEHVRVAELPTMWTNKKERRQYAVKDGDLLVCEGGDVGRAAIVCGAPDGTIIQNALHRVRPQGENETRFLLYVLAHAASQGWFEIICNKSTIAHFTVDKFGALGVALPTPAEQRAIAAFLDRETGRVDRLVTKKRELIERLKEKRTALISRTVTRGLPAEAAAKAGLSVSPPLKPSGVEWLGDIPKHWELLTWRRLILSLKDFGSNGSFAGLKENVEYLHEPDFAQLIRLTDLRGELEHEGAIYVSEESFKYLKHSSLQGGEFLIANVGAHAGLVVEMPKIDRPATLGPNMMFAKRIREDKVSTRYLILSAQSDLIRSQLTMIANASSAQPKLNKDDVRSVLTPLPPLPEQAAIAAYLDEETAKLDALVGKVEEAVERLQEYRTALITAAVTGKIDVRKEATP